MTRESYLSEPAMVLLITINSIISLLAICGNAFVVGAFLVSPKVRTRSNFFLCSLAAADLLAGIVCIPMWNFVLYTEATEGVRDNEVYMAYQSSLDPLFGVASIMNLLAVSLVRLWMVKQPLQFDAMKKRCKYPGSLGASVLLSTATATLVCVVCECIHSAVIHRRVPSVLRGQSRAHNYKSEDPCIGVVVRRFHI